jgi:hypothetical protein
MTQPILLDGYAKHQNLNNPERLANARWEYPLQMCRWIHEETARRTAESRKMFRWKFFRGDCHSHTVHSDGIGTVAETAKMVKATGLDFQFVTDHWGLTQTPECNEHKLWVGQEPAHGQYHHLGILGLNFAYNPGDNFFRNVAELKALGATVFIPHPAGWQPNVRYNDEQKRALESLPDPFLMEIVNGATPSASSGTASSPPSATRNPFSPRSKKGAVLFPTDRSSTSNSAKRKWDNAPAPPTRRKISKLPPWIRAAFQPSASLPTPMKSHSGQPKAR